MSSPGIRLLFRCDGCDAEYKHPKVDECSGVNGLCEHLDLAGWRPVMVTLKTFPGRQPTELVTVFSRGGFLCRDCCERWDL